jgi:hypothetical protein
MYELTLRSRALATAGALALVMIAGCGDDNAAADFETVRARARGAVASQTGRSYSVAVWRDGRIVFAEAFGTRGPGGTAATPDTLYRSSPRRPPPISRSTPAAIPTRTSARSRTWRSLSRCSRGSASMSRVK